MASFMPDIRLAGYLAFFDIRYPAGYTYYLAGYPVSGKIIGISIRYNPNHGCGEEYHVGKRGRGSKIILPTILNLLGRISRGEGDGDFGEEIRDFDTMGKNIKL